MIIKVKVKTETEQIIELKTPAYFSDYNNQYKVDENAVLQVGKRFLFATEKEGTFYNSEVEKTVKFEPSTEADFMNAYNECMGVINPIVNNTKAVLS